VINVFSVEIFDFSASRELSQLFNRTNADNFLSIIGDPDRNGISPVSVSGEAPVFSINKPVVESLFLDERRNPGASLIVLNELFLNVGHFDEPCVKGSVDQRGL